MFLVGVLIVMMLPATSAFAIVITPVDRFPPGQGPSFNASGGLTNAVEKTRGKGNSDIVIVKLKDKASPS